MRMQKKLPRIALIGSLALLSVLALAAPSLAMGERVLAKCVVGGCGSELCTDASAEGMASTCEVRPADACFKQFSRCEPQTNGKCGWTSSDQLTACIAKAQHNNAQ